MPTRPIVLVSGLPGAGKSSVARRIAEQVSPSMHLRVDDLRAMMVCGYVSPEEARGWSDQLGQQLVLESQAALALAGSYSAQGVAVIIDDVAIPPVLNVCYRAQPGLHRVLLKPSLDALLQRLAQRGAVYDATFTTAAPELHAYLESADKQGWAVFDTSAWSLEQTVERVIASIPNWAA